MCSRIYSFILIALWTCIGSYDSFALRTSVHIFNCSIKENSGQKYINNENEQELDNLLTDFPAKNSGISVYVLTPCNHGTGIIAEACGKWVTDHSNEKAVLIMLNPIANGNWDSNINLIATSQAGKILTNGQLDRIKQNIMIPALEEREVSYMDPVTGYRKETYAEGTKYFMAVKLAITQLASTINPPPIGLAGISYNGKVYKAGDIIYVNKSAEKITLQAEETYNRELPSTGLLWKAAETSGTDLSNVVSSPSTAKTDFNTKLAPYFSQVTLSYGKSNISLNIFSIDFTASKDKDYVRETIWETIPIKISHNLKSTDGYLLQLITNDGKNISRSQSFAATEKELSWLAKASNDSNIKTDWYPEGNYNVIVKLFTPNKDELLINNVIKVLPKYDLKSLQAVDQKTRIAKAGDTLYLVNNINSNVGGDRTIQFTAKSTGPKNEFWPSDPDWEIIKDGHSNPYSGQTTLSTTFNTKGLVGKDAARWQLAKVKAYGDEKQIVIGIVQRNEVVTKFKPPFITDGFERIFKSLSDKINSKDENHGIKLDFSVSGTFSKFNAEDSKRPTYHQNTTESGELAASITGRYNIPSLSFSFPSKSPIVEWGIYVEAAVSGGLSYKKTYINDPDKIEAPTQGPNYNGTGSISAGAFAQLSDKTATNFMVKANGYGKVAISSEMYEDVNKSNDDFNIRTVTTSINPLVMGYSFQIKDIDNGFTVIDVNGEYEIFDRIEFQEDLKFKK